MISEPTTQSPTRIWDLPIRIFHWSIVVLIITSWATASLDLMNWHKLSGYTILALLLARIAWGIAGSTTARFGVFVRGPKAILDYGRHFWDRAPSQFAGHNPMGALSVLAMLLTLAIQTGTGLILSDTDFMNSGPLSNLVGYDIASKADSIHKFNFTLIEILVALHVAVILFYALWKRENLTLSMVTGVKSIPQSSALQALKFVPAWIAFVIAVIAGLFVWFAVTQIAHPIPG